MNYKVFGTHTGLVVSELILGTGMFGTRFGYGTQPDEVRSILAGYADAGGNFIDTSDFYQLGEAEELLGQWLTGHRDDFVLVSKFGRTHEATSSLGRLGNHRKALVQSVEASLRRLRTDRIDLYITHLPDQVTPVDEIVRGFDDLVRAGKINYCGFSNFPAWRVAVATTMATQQGWSPIAGVQVDYSLLQRDSERELLPMADGLGLGVMGYSPLAGGLLTGKYRRGEPGRYTTFSAGTPKDDRQASQVLDVLTAIAEELHVNSGQVAIAWVRAKGILPIIGPRSRAQLDDNLLATTFQLSDDQLHRLNTVSQPSLGYPHDMMKAPEQQAAITGGRWSRIEWPSRTVT